MRPDALGELAKRSSAYRIAVGLLARFYVHRRRGSDAIALASELLASDPDSRRARRLLARALVLEGRLEAAVESYEELHRLEPTNARYLWELGRLYLRLQKWKEAEQVLAAYVAKNDSRPARIAFARALQQVGRTAEAESQLEAVLSGNPREQDALALLGRLLRKSKPARAYECWGRLATLRPAAVEPHLQMARLKMRGRQPMDARAHFEAVVDRDPRHAEALIGLGHALAATDRDQAIHHFEQWAEREPDLAAPRLEIARLHQQARDWERAETVYRQIVERHPGDREALAQLGRLLARDPSRVEYALNLWRDVGIADPNSPYASLQRAQLLERAQRPREAEAEYRAVIERAPEEQAALIGYGRLLLAERRFAEAVDVFSTSRRLNPVGGEALLGLGRAYEGLEAWEEALAAYATALRAEPANASALLYRGRLLRRLGRLEEAIEQWRRICAATPTNVQAWHELVLMLATAEREEEALEALEEAEGSIEPSPQSSIALGNAAAVAQFHEVAVRHYAAAIAADPGDSQAYARLGEYYYRQGIVDGAFHSLLDSRERRPADVPIAKRLVETVHALNDLGIDHVGLRAGPRTVGNVLFPERLFDQVCRIASESVGHYSPVARRIAVVASSLAPGGAERQLVNTVRGLAAAQLELDISLFCVSLSGPGRRDFYLPMVAGTGVDVVAHDPQSVTAYLSSPEAAGHHRLLRRFPEDMVGPIAQWLTEFRRRRPQVVHAWQDGTNLTAVVAALLAGVPRIVLCARSIRPDNPHRRLKRFMRHAYQAVLNQPSVVLCNNSHAGARDYAEWLDLSAQAIEVVYNGIDFDILEQNADGELSCRVRREIGIPANAPVLGSAFRMSEEKRPMLWVEVAAAVARSNPSVHFVVCGDGPDRKGMLDLASKLGIAQRFHFPGPQENIAPWYRMMDVVLLTSRHEGLPNVLLEAQGLGVPVVAPDVGGVIETVCQGVTGWAVGNADAASLAERARFCLEDKEWAGRARETAPAFVRSRFGMNEMIARTLEVYGMGRAT